MIPQLHLKAGRKEEREIVSHVSDLIRKEIFASSPCSISGDLSQVPWARNGSHSHTLFQGKHSAAIKE